MGDCGATQVNQVTLGIGLSDCPFNKGLGFGPTVLHEALHWCGFAGHPQEKGSNSMRASRWRYVEWACFRWRDPNVK